MNVKKIGLLSLALVLALGTLGVSYAMWYDDLYISGNVNTGYVDVDFHSQYDNDSQGMNDPSEPGYWDFTTTPGSPSWEGARHDKDVANLASTWDQDSLINEDPAADLDKATITINNGYPCYYGSVAWDIVNNGLIPVYLYSVTLTELSKSATPIWTGETPIVIGTRYYVDVDAANQPGIDTSLDAGDDFSFKLSAHDCDQIDPWTWVDPREDIAYLDIWVHVEQDSAQKTNYDFDLAYRFAQWNE
jgi:hypothetical protein